MKMAKPSGRDIDAAGNAMSLLNTIDRGDYPAREDEEGAPNCFDEDDPDHLRRFYDAMMETLKAGPGWPGRVIGGMCYVIMFKDNEILDPESDVLDLHPKFIKQEEQLAAARVLLTELATMHENVDVCTLNDGGTTTEFLALVARINTFLKGDA
jgi:hypothetical protein